MRIRWKLMILLLAIALVPLATVAVLANRTTYRMGRRIGEESRRVLTERAEAQMALLVRDQALLIGCEGRLIELSVELQAHMVERLLAGEPAAQGNIYFSRDYDEKPDLLARLKPSPRHVGLDDRGERVPIDLTFDEQVFHLAPGATAEEVMPDLRRLTAMVPVYRTIFERNPEGPYWSFTSLENGIHSSYPGHGGYPASYDARTRIWYQRAKTLGRLCWSAPYVDVSSRRSVVTAACPVRRSDGQFAGVTAIDVTIADMLRQVTLPNAKSAVGRVVALVPRKGFDPGRIEMVNARDYPPDELGLLVVVQPSDEHRQGGWQAPPREMWLDVGDAAQHAEMIRDMIDDQPRVRRFTYEGRDTLWSYGRVLEDAYLIVNAPSDEMTAEAKEAEAAVLTLTRSQMKLTASALGVVSLIVIALARVGSRTVTRPVRRLASAAQRIAAGELDTRVEVRSRDELGELAQAFNDMVPHLQDRMKLRQSLSLAMEVQQHLLPAGPPQVEGLEIAGRSIYCDETGGDYYDFLDLSALGPHELGIAVGDVTGHGIAAALLMTSARALLRSHAGDAGTLADLMRDINRHLSADVPAGRFMTLYYMVIDGRQRTVRWANAGHDPPILYDPAADAFGELAGGNLPLGILETETYEEFRRDRLAPGQVLVVGTDGIWETHDPAGREFGKDALREIIRRHATEPAEVIGQAITAALESFRNGSPQEDDVTLVVVKVK